MASAGIRQLPSGRFKVYWRLDDGSQGSETFDTEDQAETYRNRMLVQWDQKTWNDPKFGRMKFEQWATEWWTTWSADPTLSPHSLANAERNLRLHVRPSFDRLQLRAIGPQVVQRWQNELGAKLGHDGVMASRSLLFRILQAAENEGHIAANPVRKVRAPKRPVDPEARFGRARRRTLTPEEFGRLLAASLPFYRDHLLTQVGTGLRSGELLGLRAWRVNPAGHLEVLEVRYEAGKFGSGYKKHPKSISSIRPVPLSTLVRAAVDRRLAQTSEPTDLVFPGPGGSNSVPRNAGLGLSVRNYRRAFKIGVKDSELPAAGVHLRGPHNLRATFSTWLEGAGIPTRVIDELMGHDSGGTGRGTSRMGSLYRETTPAMLARVTAAIDERLAVAEAVAAGVMPEMDRKRADRLRRRRRPRSQS